MIRDEMGTEWQVVDYVGESTDGAMRVQNVVERKDSEGNLVRRTYLTHEVDVIRIPMTVAQ
jgi:hypothetical protein